MSETAHLPVITWVHLPKGRRFDIDEGMDFCLGCATKEVERLHKEHPSEADEIFVVGGYGYYYDETDELAACAECNQCLACSSIAGDKVVSTQAEWDALAKKLDEDDEVNP